MQIEVKVSIDSAEGYERAAHTLSPHHLKDECYYDFFFDFSCRALQERSSVLRLRVPCKLESVADVEANPVKLNDGPANEDAVHRATAKRSKGKAGDVNSSGGGYDPEAEYEAFLRACRGQNDDDCIGMTEGNAEEPPASHLNSTTASPTSTAARKRTLPRPILVSGATGRLSLKQKNTVQKGHQINFVAEDTDVPADVVEALVRLVPESLFSTGMIFSPGQKAANSGAAASITTNAFTVLADYAQRRPRTDGGDSDSAIFCIVTQLREIARAYALSPRTSYGGAKRARSGSRESDAHFSQLRFASMGPWTAYTQQQLATSTLADDEEALSLLPSSVPRLEAMGGFLTHRRYYYYTGVSQALGKSEGGSPREAELREVLRMRLDTSFLLPGLAIYELEVPKCGAAVEDVKEEVCSFLKKLGVQHHTGSESKYARYVHYIAATREDEYDTMDVKLRLTNVNGYNEVHRNLQQLTQPAGACGGTSATSSDAPRSLQEKRYVSNTEVDGEDDDDDDTWWQTNRGGYLQETNEDFFFDSPEQTLRRSQTFLRLRKQHHLNQYILVLKAHQAFTGGQQRSLSSKLDLSEDVARDLIEDPTKFLCDHRDNFSLMKTIWEEFAVHELCRAATFTTERLTVPWWSAKSQMSTLQRSWMSASANGTSLAPQRQPIYISTSYFLSQKQQLLQGDDYELGSKAPKQQALAPPVLPLLVHLDKTLYKMPPNVNIGRAPFSEGRPWADRQCEAYEIEVTSIGGSTDPKEVIKELTTLLNGMGVEWTVGVRSKLEQYFALIDA